MTLPLSGPGSLHIIPCSLKTICIGLVSVSRVSLVLFSSKVVPFTVNSADVCLAWLAMPHPSDLRVSVTSTRKPLLPQIRLNLPIIGLHSAMWFPCSPSWRLKFYIYFCACLINVCVPYQSVIFMKTRRVSVSFTITYLLSSTASKRCLLNEQMNEWLKRRVTAFQS